MPLFQVHDRDDRKYKRPTSFRHRALLAYQLSCFRVSSLGIVDNNLSYASPSDSIARFRGRCRSEQAVPKWLIRVHPLSVLCVAST